jgi:hypothetical protein
MLDRHEELEHYSNYSEYSKTLRAWLVAYGIGGPVLLNTNERLLFLFHTSPLKSWIVGCFLAGVFGQVLLGFLNKWCAYHMYLGTCKRGFKRTVRYRFWNYLNERNWIDLTIDGLSITSFVAATVLCLMVVI